MTSFWSRYFPERSVASIVRPTWVRIDASVVSPNAHEGPISKKPCAAACLWLLGRGGEELGTEWVGENIALASDDGPTILVPLAQTAITNALDAIPIAALPAGSSATKARELCLAHGARVELRAVVEPLPRESYRERPNDLRASPEHGPISIYVYAT